MASTLVVRQEPPESPGEGQSSSVFSIDAAIEDLTRDEWEERFGPFGNLDLPSEPRLPVYRILWNQFTNSVADHNDIDLVLLSLVAQRLETRLKATSPSHLRCVDLDPKFEAVVVDVAATNDVETNATPPVTLRVRIRQYLVAVLGLVPFVCDELFSMIWRLVTGLPSETTTVFVPSVGRFDSMRPIIEAADFDFEVVISPMTLALLRPGTDFSDIEPYEPTTFSQFVTLGALLNQMVLLRRLFAELVTDRTMERAFTRHLSAETDVRLNATVAYGMYVVFDAQHFRDLLYYSLTDRVIDRVSPENIVVGSGAPFGMSVLAAGQHRDLNLYHVPHGISAPRRGTRMVDVTEFLSGDLDYQYIYNKEYVSDMSKYTVTGRPYLEDLANRDIEYDIDSTEFGTEGGSGNGQRRIRIMIASTPMVEEIRTEFIEQVLDATADLNREIVIKTHPTESTEFYRETFGGRNVSITDANLFDHLVVADLVVMMTSNVGIEGILCGTPCVSINFLSPQMLVQPYVLESCIPVLRTSEDVDEFFVGLSGDTTDDLYTEQIERITSDFVLSDTTENILSHIRNDSR